jgi:UDPglucose--hexose-1-phosphate uridylyltransferase
VPNKYPAVIAGGADALSLTTDRSTGTGVHEVIIENAAHIANLAALDEPQFIRIFHAYRERLRTWREDPRWRFRLIFKNQGEPAGATFEHAHAQLIALPFVPADVAMVPNVGDYTGVTPTVYCSLIERDCEHQYAWS